MKKIVALIGTRAKESNTKHLCELIVSTMRELAPEADYQPEYIRPDNLDIKPCQGCHLCFRTGKCPQQDDLDVLKQKLLCADYIILGSPVYAAGVTADMKLWIDRLSLWLHTMPLIGKQGAVISTASCNNGNSAIDFLESQAYRFGIQVEYKYNVYVDAGSDILLRDEDAVIKEIKTLLNNRKGITQFQKDVFAYHNKRFSKILEIGKKYPFLVSEEAKLWEQQGYNAYNTLEALIEAVQNKSEKGCI